jgi:hypothetical protein
LLHLDLAAFSGALVRGLRCGEEYSRNRIYRFQDEREAFRSALLFASLNFYFFRLSGLFCGFGGARGWALLLYVHANVFLADLHFSAVVVVEALGGFALVVVAGVATGAITVIYAIGGNTPVVLAYPSLARAVPIACAFWGVAHVVGADGAPAGAVLIVGAFVGRSDALAV